MGRLRIIWVKSAIGYAEDQKATIRALGLHHLNETVEKEDTAAIRGMAMNAIVFACANPVPE